MAFENDWHSQPKRIEEIREKKGLESVAGRDRPRCICVPALKNERPREVDIKTLKPVVEAKDVSRTR